MNICLIDFERGGCLRHRTCLWAWRRRSVASRSSVRWDPPWGQQCRFRRKCRQWTDLRDTSADREAEPAFSSRQCKSARSSRMPRLRRWRRSVRKVEAAQRPR